MKRNQIDFIVGTTGIVREHIIRRNIDLTHVQSIIVDEAEEIATSSFRVDIDFIMENQK